MEQRQDRQPTSRGPFPQCGKMPWTGASCDPQGSSVAGKPPVGLGASQGLFGTLRSQLHWRQILSFMDADLVHRPEVLVSEAHLKLEPRGQVNDPISRHLMRQWADN
jgi:NAD(P)H-dependent FMN reductase